VEPKIVVLERLPSGATSAGAIAQQIYQSVGPGRRGLVVLVAGQNVAAQGGGLSQEELDGIVQSAARTFDSESYAAGIAQIVRAADQKRGQQVANNWYLVLGAGILLAGGVYLVMRSKRKRNTARLNEARERTHEFSVRLELQLQALKSDFEDTLPNQNDVARATQAFSSAMQLLDNAQTADEYEAAFHALHGAEIAIQQARDGLESQTLDENAVLDQSEALNKSSSLEDDAHHPTARPAAQDVLSST
jgi:LPXTG-motif cell wall-anchored protein